MSTHKFSHGKTCAGEVLFPGQTLHLKVIEPKIIAAIERALNQANASYILGVVCN